MTPDFPPALVRLQNIGGIMACVSIALYVAYVVAPVACDRAWRVLCEFGRLVLTLLQHLIAIADAYYPDNERRWRR